MRWFGKKKRISRGEIASPKEEKVPEKGEMEPCIAFHSALKEWTKEEWGEQERLKEMIFSQLALAMKSGNVGGREAQTLVLLHRKWLLLFWREGMYTKQNHLMIGKIYVAEPRFGQFYDGRVGRGGAEFLRDAIEIYVLRGGALVEFPEEKHKRLESSGGMVTVAQRRKK